MKVPSAPLIGSENRVINEPVESSDQAWRALGWFGLMLAIVGFSDVVLVFYPPRWGDPGWEFGVVDTALSTFPLLVVGIAALIGSLVARRKRGPARVVAGFAITLAVLILAAYTIYLTTIPVALRMSPPEVLPGIHKSIARTSIMALAFSTMFIVGGVMAIRATRTPGNR